MRLYATLILTFFIRLYASAQVNLPDFLQNDTTLRYALWSVHAVYADSNQTILSHNSSFPLPPASTAKIITTAAALHFLGSNFIFQTHMEYSGNITSDGVLNGNLIIKGNGDPTFGSPKWKYPSRDSLIKTFIRALRNAGIKKINGDILADASAWQDVMTPPGWSWSDLGNGFGAPPSGLSFADNIIYLTFKSGKTGTKAELVKTEPEIPGVKWLNYVTAGDKGTDDNTQVNGSEYATYRQISGTVPPHKKEYTIRASNPDPPLSAAHFFRKILVDSGCIFTGSCYTSRDVAYSIVTHSAITQNLFSWISPRLKEIDSVVNHASNNLYAEHLLRALDSGTQKQVSHSGGIKKIQEFASLCGVNPNACFITDGSGLSRNNAVSTENMVRVLRFMTHHPEFGSFYSSFPIAGRSGTVAEFAKNTAAEGNARIKTGTLSRVKSYAGYTTDKSGRLIAFSMIFSQYSCSNSFITAKAERIVQILSERN